MPINWKKAIQIGFTIMGTIIGAGFASGQEIYLFFSQFGPIGTVNIIVSTLFTIWLIIKVMTYAKHHLLQNPQDFYGQLFGQKGKPIASVIMIFSLFVISCVMLAGAGAALQSLFNLPYWTAAIITIVLLLIILHFQLTGIYWVNNFVVPILLTFIILLTIQHGLAHPVVDTQHPVEPTIIKSLIYCISYVSLNSTLALTILLSIGASNETTLTLRLGGLLGGIGIGLLLLCSNYLLQHHVNSIEHTQLPIAHLAQSTSAITGASYVLLVYLEIVTTLIANLFSISTHLTKKINVPAHFIVPILLLLCLFLGQFGFAKLLSMLYPIIGGLGFIWISWFLYRTSRKFS